MLVPIYAERGGAVQPAETQPRAGPIAVICCEIARAHARRLFFRCDFMQSLRPCDGARMRTSWFSCQMPLVSEFVLSLIRTGAHARRRCFAVCSRPRLFQIGFRLGQRARIGSDLMQEGQINPDWLQKAQIGPDWLQEGHIGSDWFQDARLARIGSRLGQRAQIGQTHACTKKSSNPRSRSM